MILVKTITFVSKFQLILKLDCFYCTFTQLRTSALMYNGSYDVTDSLTQSPKHLLQTQCFTFFQLFECLWKFSGCTNEHELVVSKRHMSDAMILMTLTFGQRGVHKNCCHSYLLCENCLDLASYYLHDARQYQALCDFNCIYASPSE